MNELKPCPFCGGEASGNVNVNFDEEHGFLIKFSVGCKRCDVFINLTCKAVSNMSIYNVKNAIKIVTDGWNRRVEG